MLLERYWFQHHFNDLNLYARLCRIMPGRWAKRVAVWLSVIINPLLYRRRL